MPKIELVPVGALLVDLDTKLTASTARLLARASDRLGRPLGIRGIIRYVSIGEPSDADLTYDEAAAILGEGLSIMAVQHAHSVGWLPDATRGFNDGLHAGTNALKAGCMPGMSLWCDLEGVNASATVVSTAAWANRWHVSAHSTGFDPGIYDGWDSILNPHDLYSLLAFRQYWSSLSMMPPPEHRGFCMFQIYGGSSTSSGSVDGIPVDFNVCGRDRFGGGPSWMSP